MKSYIHKEMYCQICGITCKCLGKHLKHTHNITDFKNYYDTYIKKDNEGICPVCQKPTVFLGITKGYRQHCSTVCSSLDKEVQKKNAQTNIERHGYIQPLAQSEIHQKGVEASKSNESKERRKNTCLNKFGTETNLQTEENKEKAKTTYLSKYGVEHSSKSETVKQHIKDSFIEHYGVDHNMRSTEGYKAYQDGIIQKYGVDHISKVPELHAKAVENGKATKKKNKSLDERLNQDNM